MLESCDKRKKIKTSQLGGFYFLNSLEREPKT